MFSPTMMASSTTMPSTVTNANNDMMLMETSRLGIKAIAPRNETGIPRLTQSARRRSRKRASAMKTSANPVAPVRSISDSRALNIFAVSCQIVSEIPAGRRVCASSI